jgi:hypothetical protein
VPIYVLGAFLSQQYFIDKLAQCEADLLQSFLTYGGENIELAPMSAVLSLLNSEVSSLCQAMQCRVQRSRTDAPVAAALQFDRQLRAVDGTLLGALQDVDSQEAAKELLKHIAPLLRKMVIGIRYRLTIS